MRRILKIVAISVGVVALGIAVGVAALPFMISHQPGGTEPNAVEQIVVQAAIDTFMAEHVLTEITPSTSGAGGEKINGTGTQFHATLDLQSYIRDLPSTYCYLWQSNGRIIRQYDVNSNGNCAIEADQLFP